MMVETRRAGTGDDLADEQYAAIARFLIERRQFDLTQYKDRCVRRRIAKRMRACGAPGVPEYLERLQNDPNELNALQATISIHVSQFFRDPDIFRVLETQVLPDLCRRVKATGRDTLRLWSVGCAGGEEPYSLALLIDEMAPVGIDVQILGTDISAEVLVAAREGLFERTRLTEVPTVALQRYFYEENGRYRLAEPIRDKVRFERHDTMTAEAYPPADLILCRNVLIYFSRPEQKRIIKRFAATLSSFGVLVLGRSEILVGDIRDLYQTDYPVERIYRRSVDPT